ncbi:hypothetical protein [Pseudarthrobacter sp. BIM B-2242]|uniref:hypothetical protein n=1 Tax=Pseudarthrobacter sp. BIM B-2242 TaxID=2772401 RepID=UPI00168BE5A3|nr:hypothetical protein [Pseudarthrobacter sp. BIM B-2242]QOD05917.1 hypothetical protein IDT60_20315 [Pseudarthrobacter sp. BIM B-2242]
MDNDTTTAQQGAGHDSGTLSSSAATPPAPPAPPAGDAMEFMSAPDYPPSLPSWAARDYAAFITGSGAAKLADSGVAPLVAAARGYKRLDETNYATEAKIMNVGPARSQKGQPARLKRTLAAHGKDGMQMPWYSVADIQIANRDKTLAKPFTYQVRPGVPELNEHEKPIKYEFIASAGTPLDLHPGTPVNWIDSTPVVMFAEGLLKGDAALSAYLHANGVPYDQLAYDPRDGDPSDRLREMLNAIPEEKRILILSIAGIWNTHQNPIDWREIQLKGREAWIAFDADTGINPHVHAAAFKLSESLETKSKMEPVMFLSPVVPSDDDGTLAKAGIDDYLAKHGTWDMLLLGLKASLPDAPPRSDNEYNGAVRVSKDGFTVEECTAVNDGPGGTIGSYKWTKIVDLGGRIKTMETRRQPTDDELRTGIFDPNVQAHDIDDAIVEIEVAWTLGGKDDKGIIVGPKTILHFTPADWVRQKAIIPDNILCHPAWPPRAAKGESWLAALKTHRTAETVQRTRWQQMGWVPVEGSDPVFIVGSQVIGEATEGATVSGVGTGEIPVADMFGVGVSKVGDDLDDETVRESIRQDFRDVVGTYITAGAWKDRSTAALVLAGALRPTIPLRPRSTIYLWGPKGKGKSWSAKAMMYFWAKNLSTWQDQLPGSAKDTVAYIETCVSRTPIWVVDDLAPSPIKRQAEAEDGKLADLTRSIFNNATKGRMNADMSARKVNKPIAQLIITAENELTTPSAKERLIPAYIGHGKLAASRVPTDAINDLAKERGVPARFTGHLIRFIRQTAISTPGGWATFFTRMEELRTGIQSSTEAIMKEMGTSTGSLERTSSLAADVLLTFEILRLFADELEMEDEFLDLFSLKDGLGRDIISLVSSAHAENAKSSPGTSLVRALSALLASGGAHVVNADDPSVAPIEGTDDSGAMANHRLGWSVGSGSDGKLKANGPSIGTVVTKNGEKIILFDVETAFSKAQTAYPTLIQHGQGTGSAWASIWDENLNPSSITRQVNSRGALVNTVRFSVGTGAGRMRPTGVPIPVDTILGGGVNDHEDDIVD